MTLAPSATPRQRADSIARAWREVVTSGDARGIVVTGPAAARKSVLVCDAIAGLRPKPSTLLIGHARTRSPGPYDWTASALAARALDEVPVSADALAWLTQRAGDAARMEPTALRRAALTAIGHLVAKGPAVLVAENAHRLDPASLQLLSELCGRAELPVLTLIIARDDGTGSHARFLRALIDSPDTGVVTVPMSPARRPTDPVAWARYANATGDSDAAAACLVAAAELLRADRDGEARQLIEDCLADADTREPVPESESGTRLALARCLVLLGRPSDARRAIDDDSASLTDTATRELAQTLRTIDELTAREREVLDCLAAGMANRQVAKALGISVRTVTVHVSNLLRKTGTGSRTEAALWAVKHGLSPRLGRPGNPPPLGHPEDSARPGHPGNELGPAPN